MDSFQTLKRRTTDLVSSIPNNAPSMPNVQLPAMPHVQMPAMPNLQLPSLPKIGGSPDMKGSWQHVQLPQLPRSSHSVDVVAGNVYIFGGEVEPRKPVDNDMHVIVLPASGASADYYTVKAKGATTTSDPVIQATAAPAAAPVKPAAIPEDDEDEDEDESEEEEEDESEEEDEEEDSDEDDDDSVKKEKLDEVPLTSPTTTKASTSSAALTAADKGKGKELATVPSSRVGHATAVIGSRIFLFGGRNSDSQTLEENGRVWVFSTRTNQWSFLDPHTTSPVPPARSYFSAVASDKPRDFTATLKPLRKRTQSWKQWAEGDSAEVGIPQAPVVGHVAEHSTDEEEDGYGTFIIHGGCLANGDRTADVWAFDVHSATWKELPSAPGPARGGACLAMVHDRLYRFGGYDGQGQQGGQLDVLELSLDESQLHAEIGASVPRGGGWQSTIFPSITRTTTNADGESTVVTSATADFPGNRSVASMNLVIGGGGYEYLILMLGERDASTEGHAGAGKFWNDIWAFQVPPVAGTAASFSSKIWEMASRLGGGGGEHHDNSQVKGLADGTWYKVTMGPHDEDEPYDAQGPGPRGWLGSASLGSLEENGVVVFGGLSEENRRLGDLWIFRLE